MSYNPWWKQSHQTNNHKSQERFSEYQNLVVKTEIERKIKQKFDFSFSSFSEPLQNEENKDSNNQLSSHQLLHDKSVNKTEEDEETAEKARLRSLKITQLIEIGLSQYQNKNYEHSTQTFKQVLSLESTNPEANYWLGLIYLQEQQLTKAEEFLLKADGEEGYVEAQYWLGVIAQQEGKLAEASNYYSSFLNLSPHNLLAEKAALELNEIKFKLLFG